MRTFLIGILQRRCFNNIYRHYTIDKYTEMTEMSMILFSRQNNIAFIVEIQLEAVLSQMEI